MKVLGIGLGRTGTTSLARALQLLGYETKHCPEFWLGDHGELVVSPDDIERHQGLTDEPVILVFRELDRRHPGSKFILTVREKQGWLRSVENNGNVLREHRARQPAVPVLFEALYGSATFDPARYGAAYDRHVADVQAYFAERPDDLLVLDVCAGDGWEKLCPFVERPLPDRPFPKLNVFGESDAATLVAKGRMTAPGVWRSHGARASET